MGEFKGVALVTGASSGIGEIFARKLSARGCRLLLVARRRDRLERLATELGNAEAIAADLTEAGDLRRLEQRMTEESRLEYLVNNAGFGSVGYFFEADRARQDEMQRLHVLATMRLTHAALAGMIARKSGNIINVSSVAAFFHNPFNVTYGASKAWINNFSEALSVELRSIGSPVRVQALCPGFTYTEFHDVLGVDRKAVPKGFWLTAEDVVDASLQALVADRVIVIPGWRYRLIVRVQQLLPRSARYSIALRYGARNRRPIAASGPRS
jgi:short-subunit dehydrogenase